MLKHIRERLRIVDPKFKTTEDFNSGITSEYAKEVNNDVLAFLKGAKDTDDKLRDGIAAPSGGSKLDKSIFGESKVSEHVSTPS